jgi:hypothetical protein
MTTILRTIVLSAALCMLGAVSNQTDNWLVREDGIGPVTVGMTLSQLNGILHERFVLPEEKGDRGCFYVHPVHHPQVSFMIEDGRFSRVDVDSPGVFTTERIEVGDSEQRVLKIYAGKLKIEQSHYTGPEGHYLTVRSGDRRYGLRFETENGKVTTFYAGRLQAVQYVEGCD